jgi:iron(III) transport system ATP-binding protein
VERPDRGGLGDATRTVSHRSTVPGPGGEPSPGPDEAVRLRGVTKRFGAVVAVDDLDLDVRRGEMLALLGPSGCGKTTVLRCIAGFEDPDAGWIEIGGRPVAGRGTQVPPERRRVGFVFQDLALFPHLTVADNIGYGLRGRPDRRARIDRLLDLVGLTGHGHRMPHELSGGMQQRVALARALAPEPEIVLLDEPFSSLDAAHRTRLRFELREILRAAGATAVFVTHDQEEALTIADRVAVMVRGRIVQSAPPEVLYDEPANPFVATFVGIANLVHAELRDGFALTPFGSIRLADGSPYRGDGGALVVLRPEQLEAVPAGFEVGDDAGQWRIRGRRFAGSEILLDVVGPTGLRLWCEADPAARRLEVGGAVTLRFRGQQTVAFAVGGPNRDAEAARSGGPEAAWPGGSWAPARASKG